jgi:hypothetical protein
MFLVQNISYPVATYGHAVSLKKNQRYCRTRRPSLSLRPARPCVPGIELVGHPGICGTAFTLPPGLLLGLSWLATLVCGPHRDADHNLEIE